MKNIYRNSFYNLNKAKRILEKNQILALPTETVYGLAGNAYSHKSVKRIYSLKKRPQKNPLIIHYYNLELLKKDAEYDKNFLRLYKENDICRKNIKCGHYFHQSCIDTWYANNNKCPICDQVITKNILFYYNI